MKTASKSRSRDVSWTIWGSTAGRGEKLLFVTSRLGLETYGLPLSGYRGLSPGIRRLGREPEHSPLSTNISHCLPSLYAKLLFYLHFFLFAPSYSCEKLRHACPSVHLSARTIRFQVDRFWRNFILKLLWKICPENSSRVKIWQE
jgi:hypothetical protein